MALAGRLRRCKGRFRSDHNFGRLQGLAWELSDPYSKVDVNFCYNDLFSAYPMLRSSRLLGPSRAGQLRHVLLLTGAQPARLGRSHFSIHLGASGQRGMAAAVGGRAPGAAKRIALAHALRSAPAPAPTLQHALNSTATAPTPHRPQPGGRHRWPSGQRQGHAGEAPRGCAQPRAHGHRRVLSMQLQPRAADSTVR